MTGSLKETLDAVGEIMNVTLVPFGNARYENKKLVCQHGEDECKANSWEQCAMSLYPDFSKHFPFYLCVEQSSKSCGEGGGACVLSHIESCATSASLDYSSIKACVDDPVKSAALQEAAHEATPSDHAYVPWVVVNGKTLKDSDKLLSQVCKEYKGIKPKGCKKVLEAEEQEAKRCSAKW